METIMSKTNDTYSNLSHDTPEDHHTLADSELDAVTGGGSVSNVIDGLAKATIGTASSSGPPDVWVGCAWVPQWW
jgi:hypothetical protein